MQDENINILHLVHRYAIGGAEMVVANLCKHSSPNINNIICSFTAPDLEFVRDHPVSSLISLDKKEGNDPRLVSKLKSIIKDDNIHIVHAQGWATYLEGLLAAKCSIKKRTKFIFAFHGKTLQDVQNGIPWRRRLAQKGAAYFSDKIIAPSQEMVTDYQNIFQVHQEKTQLIYNGVEIKSFSAKTNSPKEAIGLDENDFVIGFVGRLDPVKNIPGIIKAFEKFLIKLKSNERNISKLLLIGDGPKREELEELVDNFSLTQNIIFLGRSNQIPACLAAMDVYIQPSFYEGHSNTIIEAMAASLPVITTDVGGTKEIINNGINGFLLQPEDDERIAIAMLDCYNSKRLRKTIGAAAQKTAANNFSVEQMVDGYESMYKSLLYNT